jgi:dehydrogenase/reductase SDR family member 4
MNPFTLNDKVALITGASKGIGKGIARAFYDAGASVIISSRNPESLQEAAREIDPSGEKVKAIAANAGNMDDIQKLAEESIQSFGKINILVNNAAANPVFGPVLDTPLTAFDKIMDVNLKGPFELAKQLSSSMKISGGGSIINISSIGGITPEPMLGIYSVSKAALISLTKVLAKELGRDGIRANVICPGLIKTKFSEALWSDERLTNKIIGKLPISRIGTEKDISGLALFLASEAAAYCTGAVFTADGGYTI